MQRGDSEWDAPALNKDAVEGRERVVFIPTLEMSQHASGDGAEFSPHENRGPGGDGPHSAAASGDNQLQSRSLMEASVDSGIQETTRVEDVSGVRPTMGRRILDAVLLVRLEIFLALFVVARFMTMTPIQDLLLQKACLNRMHYNESICSHLDDYEQIKNEAEKAASMTSMIRTIVSLAPGAIIAIFVGPWCDKYGYRTPLLSAMTGFLLSTALTMMTVYHMWMPLYVNILTTIPDGLSGGFIVVFTAIYSEATLTTDSESRRARFFALNFTMSLCSPLAAFSGGQLYGHFGWRTVLYVSFVIASLSIVWILVAIKDLVKPEHAQDGLWVKFRNLFEVTNLAEGFKTSMKPRPNKGRAQLWCLFGAVCCVVFDMASMGTMYYYVRKMYSWTVAHYATVSSISSVSNVAMSVPIIFLFVKVLKISDPAMALVGISFAIVQMTILGLAFKEWLYYLHCVFGIPTFLGQVGVRTHLSKLVGQDEVGKVFSFLASFDAVVPVLGEVLITSLFNWSLNFLPGLPYLVAAGITCIAAGLIAYVTKVHREGVQYEDMSKQEAVPAPIND
ncbi:proton-coupled folate transporter isoform X4 [Dermacentor silvarum]|uniref:proton-coupled folate transporter isoform X3 n=1 Tax=Dermacentor silvarum TaxID=543639 RepID=UPI002100A576|nr:proton-coupled folate transporter isoform X3 [Dermacentor silvarum]XP_049514493.1 proton-coupled folate transporter isoform X4 [Dermacentor silvarum]